MPILAGDTASVAMYVELDGTLDASAMARALRAVALRAQPASPDAPGDVRVEFDTIDLAGRADPRDVALRWMESFVHPGDAPDLTAHLITLGADHQILHVHGRPAGLHSFRGSTFVDHLAAAYAASTGGPGLRDDAFDHRPVPVGLPLTEPAILVESRTLSPSASADLRAMADRCGVRIESVVVAGVTGYLGAVCLSDEILIGLPTPTEVGAASTTLPLRLSAAPHRTVADLVSSTEDRIVNARANRHTPPGRPRHGRPTADTVGPVPVVNVIPSLGPVRFADVAGDVFILCGGPVDDLRVNVYDAQDGRIRVDVEAHPDLHTRADVRVHHDRFLGYLARFVAASPTMLLAGIDVISVAEHIEIVDEWNSTDELVPPATLADLVEMGLARDHDRLAFVGDGTDGAHALTHGEMDCRVSQLARVLMCAGVGPESVVGVMTDDRAAGVTAMLAVVRAGGAVLPLDPTHTAEVIAHRIAAAHPICVVTDRVLTDSVLDPDDAAMSSAPGVATGYDAIPPWVDAIPLDDSALDEFPDDPISTTELSAHGHLGNPAWIAVDDDVDGAAVVLTHGAIANRLQWMHAGQRSDVTDMVPVDISAGADWLWESLWPLTIGATIELTSAAVAPRGPAGPAEVAFGVLNHGVPDDDRADDHAETARVAGRPVWNSSAYVLDARMRPLPAGVVGELYLAGDQIARGYAADPGATADRFVANPFRPGRRMFRTGTAARWRADGVIEYVVPTARPTVDPAKEAVSSTPPDPRTLADIVCAAATAAPDAIAAIVDRGPDDPARSITYRDLDEQSNQWARLLIACDVGPEDVVAVALPHGIDALIAIWAVAKSGAALVTVDPGAVGATDQLVPQVITDSDLRFGFASAATGSEMMSAHGEVRWMTMDTADYRNVVSCLSTRPIRPASRHARLDVDHLAYVAYTTTDGTPARGVGVANRGLSTFAEEQRVRCGVERSSRTLHATTVGDPISILEVLLATSAAATMVIAAGERCPSPSTVARVLREHGVTHAFLDAPMLASMSPDGLPDLQKVVTGRMLVCTPALVERWTTPERAVLNGYGRSDATAGLVVLDKDLRPVAAGTPGELYLTGPALARGFMGTAALTATRFVANPWHRGIDRAGSVLYRTGEIVTLGPDGRITYLGRSDSFA